MFRRDKSSLPTEANTESKLSAGGDEDGDEGTSLVIRPVVPKAKVFAGNLKTTLAVAGLAQTGFLLLAAISYLNNTVIMCAYREHLSLRELVFIALREHGACVCACVRACVRAFVRACVRARGRE